VDRTYNLNGGFKPTTKRTADLGGPDFYPTPRWATFALIENETFRGDIWECSCGDGAMSNVLSETGNVVASSDLYDRGFGEVGHDFLTTQRTAPNIITNPPFHSAESFVTTATQQARGKVAMLLRLSFLEGANRANTIFHRIRQVGFGCSASASPSIRRARKWLVAEQRHTPGSFGTKTALARPNSRGSGRATRLGTAACPPGDSNPHASKAEDFKSSASTVPPGGRPASRASGGGEAGRPVHDPHQHTDRPPLGIFDALPAPYPPTVNQPVDGKSTLSHAVNHRNPRTGHSFPQ
jgi:hypothetical protein